MFRGAPGENPEQISIGINGLQRNIPGQTHFQMSIAVEKNIIFERLHEQFQNNQLSSKIK